MRKKVDSYNIVNRIHIYKAPYSSAKKAYSGANKPRWKPKTYGQGGPHQMPEQEERKFDPKQFERQW